MIRTIDCIANVRDNEDEIAAWAVPAGGHLLGVSYDRAATCAAHEAGDLDRDEECVSVTWAETLADVAAHVGVSLVPAN